jgi:hypothetical protein
MVLVTNTIKPNLVWHAVQYLRHVVTSSEPQDALTEAFICWLDPKLCRVDWKTLLLDAQQHAGAGRTYQDVAVLGYGSASAAFNQEMQHRLTEGLDWMAGRPAKVQGQWADFCSDGVALFGMALGAVAVGKLERVVNWFAAACDTSTQFKNEAWQQSLITAARNQLLNPAEPERAIEDVSTKLALFSRGVTRQQATDAETAKFLEALQHVEDVDIRAAAVHLAAFKQIQSVAPALRPASITKEQVADLLRAIPHGLLRWTWENNAKTTKSSARKWYIDHEYHVQNLLWFLIGSIFPDAVPEEYVESVGSVHPRLDIAVPSLQLIIEVKFWRVGEPSGEMIRQIGEDASLYLATKKYTAIIAIIWDEGRRTEQYPLMTQGLKKIAGVCDAILVSKPASMEDVTGALGLASNGISNPTSATLNSTPKSKAVKKRKRDT